MGLLSKCFQRQPQSRLVPPLHDSPPARPSLHALSLVLVTRWRGVRLPLQTHRFVDFICELPPESCVGGRQTLVGVLLLNPRKQRPFSQEFGRCCDCPLLVWLLASATVPSVSVRVFIFSRTCSCDQGVSAGRFCGHSSRKASAKSPSERMAHTTKAHRTTNGQADSLAQALLRVSAAFLFRVNAAMARVCF